MNSVTGMASDILSGLYNPSDINITTTSYWVRNNLGKLNTSIFASFALSGVGDDQLITGDCPSWNDKTRDIYKKMHEVHYYRKQIMSTLPAGTNNQVLELNSDGARIKMVNKSEVAKTYKDLKRDAENELEEMIADFNIYNAKISQVSGDDIFQSYSIYSSDYNRA